MLQTGITHTESALVTEQNIASALGSGTVAVFATPAMINLIELTCAQSVASELEPGQTTVGTELNIKHNAPTPIDMEVRCTSNLVEVKGRSLTFWVEVTDGIDVVGQGTHARFIVDEAKFESKANSKKAKLG